MNAAVPCYLLDVNVLIALVDPAHLQHEPAHVWFSKRGQRSFATCPITENGLLRIVGNPKYPSSPGAPNVVLPALQTFRDLPGHHFWPDDLSFANSPAFAARLLTSHNRVTDSYLLALAQVHQGKLASFDRKLATEVVADGLHHLEVIAS